MMRKDVFILLSLALVLLVHSRVAADSVHTGRIGCPHCKSDSTEITQLLKKADLLYTQFKPKEAAAELAKVLEMNPNHHEALAKMSRAHIDIGDMIPESVPDWQEKRMKEYVVAEDYARKAVKSDADSTWGHFYVAASLGKIAVLSPVSKQVDLAEQIRQAVEKSISIDPQNGYAYHVYGVWHRKMAEIGQMSRVFASMVLWRSIPQGTMDKSIDYLHKAVSLNPTVIATRLELARTYLATEQWSLARNYLKSIQDLPVQFSDDPIHKKKASQLLQEIKDR